MASTSAQVLIDDIARELKRSGIEIRFIDDVLVTSESITVTFSFKDPLAQISCIEVLAVANRVVRKSVGYADMVADCRFTRTEYCLELTRDSRMHRMVRNKMSSFDWRDGNTMLYSLLIVIGIFIVLFAVSNVGITTMDAFWTWISRNTSGATAGEHMKRQ